MDKGRNVIFFDGVVGWVIFWGNICFSPSGCVCFIFHWTIACERTFSASKNRSWLVQKLVDLFPHDPPLHDFLTVFAGILLLEIANPTPPLPF